MHSSIRFRISSYLQNQFGVRRIIVLVCALIARTLVRSIPLSVADKAANPPPKPSST